MTDLTAPAASPAADCGSPVRLDSATGRLDAVLEMLATGEAVHVRKAAGLTQRQLAARINAAQQVVAEYEVHRRRPVSATGMRYVDFLLGLREKLAVEALRDRLAEPSGPQAERGRH